MKRILVTLFLVLGTLCSNTNLKAQSFSGTDFWFGFMMNYPNGAPDPIEFIVDVITDTTTQATISVPLAGWSQTFTVTEGVVNTVTIPWAIANHRNVSDAIRGRGVHLVADNDVIVYVGNMLRASSDAATAIPTSALGTDYHVICEGHSNATNWQSQFMIIGTEDNTNVTYNLSSLSVNSPDYNTDYTITLDKGETFQVQSFEGVSTVPPMSHYNLTGSTIRSDKPVAVYGGNVCGTPGTCQYCDHLFEQIRPLNTWGTEYYFAFTTKPSATPDDIRVYASQNGTNYVVNGVNFTLNAREFRDHPLVNGGYITSNNPIHVSQFLRGAACSAPPALIDPLMLDILPAAQFASKYQFATSSYARFIGGHRATVVIETGNEGSLELNGLPVGAAFNPIPGTTYSYGYINLTGNTYYEILSNTGDRFGLYIYGYGDDESYGYTAGGNLVNLDGCPIVDFTGIDGCQSDSISFFDASFDPKYNMVNFSIDFGDTQTLNYGTQKTIVKHKYANPGIYNVTLTITNDGPNVCSESKTVQVEVYPEPTYEAGPDLILCSNDSAVFDDGDAAITGGTAPFTINWSANNGQFVDNTVLHATFTSNQPSSVATIDIEDDNGCTISDNIQITWTPADQLILTPSDPVCFGEQSYFLVSLQSADEYDLVLNDGVSDINFNNVSDGDTLWIGPLPITTDFTIESVELSSGADACVDFDTDAIQLKVRPLPSVDIEQDDRICAGSSIDLTFDFNGNAGPYNIEYTDNNNTYTQVNISSDPLVVTHFPTQTETYSINYVEYSVAPFCRQQIADEVTIDYVEIPTVSFTGADTICEGDNINLQITLTGEGPWELDIKQPDGSIDVLTVSASGSPYVYTVAPDETGDYTILAVRMLNYPFCEDDAVNITQRIHVSEHKMAGLGGTLNWCAETPINLFDQLTNDPDSGGLWTDVNGATAQGATLNTGTGDFLGGSTITAGTYQFTYTHANDAPCPTETATIELNIYENPSGSIAINSPICEGDDTPLTFSFPKGMGPFTAVVEENGSVMSPPFNSISNGHQRLVSPTVNTTYDLVSITDGSPAQCQTTLSATATVEVKKAPQLTIIDNPCDATELFYTWVLEITGGDTASYYLDQMASTTGGTIYQDGSGRWIFESNPIPTGVSATIVIKDANDCPPNEFTKAHKCNCISDAGDLDPTPQTICGTNNTLMIETDTMFVGAGDTYDYIICEDVVNGVVIDEYARNKSGAFNINSNPALLTDSVYYVVRVVGDDDGNGQVDMLDLCISFTQKVPVIFRRTPQYTLTGPSEVCFGEEVSLTFEFTEGKPDYTVLYGPGNQSVLLTSDSSVVKDTPSADIVYQVTSVTDSYGCANTTPTNLPVTVHSLPTAVFVDDVNGFVCENNNEVNLSWSFSGAPLYDVSYTINGGAPINLTGRDNNSPAIQDFPTTTTNYEIISVTDANGCSNAGGVTSVTVGTFPSGSIGLISDSICLGNLANIVLNVNGGQGDYSFDYAWKNDNGSFTVNSGNGTIVGFSPTTIGTDNIVITNFKDQSPTPCVGNFPSIPLTVLETPTVQFNTSTPNICESQQAVNIDLVFTKGKEPFSIDYEENGVSKSIGGLPTNALVNMTPMLGLNSFKIISVSDANGICFGNNAIEQTFYQYRTPIINMPEDMLVCENEIVNFSIEVFADDSVSAIMYQANDISTVMLQPGINSFSFTALTTDTIKFTNVGYPYSPICADGGVFDMIVEVVPQANAFLSADAVICEGESIDLTFHVDQPNKDYTINYTDGTSQYSAIMQDGGTINVTPNQTTNYVLLSAIGSSGANCAANVPGDSVTIQVNPLPTVDLIVPAAVCADEQIEIILENFNGNGPFDVKVTSSDLEEQIFSEVPNNESRNFTDDHTGQDKSYWISYLADNTASDVSGGPCVSDFSEQVEVVVINELPEGALTLTDDEICEGQLTAVELTAEKGVAPYTFVIDVEGIGSDSIRNVFSGDKVGLDIDGKGTRTVTLVRIIDSATPKGCASETSPVDADTLTIHPKPEPLFSGSPLKGCGPLVTDFINETDSVRFYGDATWFFGREYMVGNNWPGISHEFNSAGYYDIALQITTEEGCQNTGIIRDYVQVYPDPVVDFMYQPNPANLSNTRIRFFNETVGGETYVWEIDTVSGDETLEIKTMTEFEPEYEFDNNDPGEYKVKLTSYSEHGCEGEFSDVVYITGELLVNIPNAFTPNGDGTNDYFRPYLFGHTLNGFVFEVYDRWGTKVFQTNIYPPEGQDWPNYGWDGKDALGSELAPGAYIYKVVVQNKYNQNYETFNGEVNLLR